MNKSLWTNEHFFAALLIFIGGGFLLQQLGFIDFGWLLGKIWPVFIICYGFLMLAQKPTERTAPLIVIAIGTILTIGSLNTLQINIWALFWPVVLIGLGILMLKRNKVPAVYSEDHYNANVTLSEAKPVFTSQNFQGGKASVWMGSNHLDLTKAKFADQVNLDVQVVMGEFKIIVPADTKVINTSSSIMAEYNDRTRTGDQAKQTLNITGSVLMGSLEVID